MHADLSVDAATFRLKTERLLTLLAGTSFYQARIGTHCRRLRAAM